MNGAWFVLCRTFDDESQLLSEYDGIHEVDDWHYEEFFNN